MCARSRRRNAGSPQSNTPSQCSSTAFTPRHTRFYHCIAKRTIPAFTHAMSPRHAFQHGSTSMHACKHSHGHGHTCSLEDLQCYSCVVSKPCMCSFRCASRLSCSPAASTFVLHGWHAARHRLFLPSFFAFSFSFSSSFSCCLYSYLLLSFSLTHGNSLNVCAFLRQVF